MRLDNKNIFWWLRAVGLKVRMGCTSAHLAEEYCVSTKDVHRVGPYSVLGVGTRSGSCSEPVDRRNLKTLEAVLTVLRYDSYGAPRSAAQKFENSRMYRSA